ncbi:hypothetical protein WL51_06975 [Burkholderia ubonensis]|uniref:hypothetical protein n=1 Tax=Burkholderia ubonensis TaxID=101571 RepID=UPI00075EA1BC|nr:hypothetical protein [Burkholderia ubonensis]KWC40825.1 hypothetical protein WL51_06975 [Burkholderia ubonensis]
MKSHKLIQIFRAGQHTAMNGAVLDFSEETLRMSAAVYDPAKRSAPLVLGHPPDDQPTFGEVRGLIAKDGKLYAQADVNSTLETLVKARRYRYVSASFLLPFSQNNPTPGAYYLRHVGFLGAHPPAVKGMQPAEFAERPSALHFCEAYDCMPERQRQPAHPRRCRTRS